MWTRCPQSPRASRGTTSCVNPLIARRTDRGGGNRKGTDRDESACAGVEREPVGAYADHFAPESGAMGDLESYSVAQAQLAQAQANPVAKHAVDADDASAVPQGKIGQFHTWTVFLR